MVIRIIISLISSVFYIYEILIFARCILSFMPMNNGITGWVYRATEPVLSPCRKLMDKFNVNLPIDFSPMVALLLMRFIQGLLINILRGFLIV